MHECSCQAGPQAGTATAEQQTQGVPEASPEQQNTGARGHAGRTRREEGPCAHAVVRAHACSGPERGRGTQREGPKRPVPPSAGAMQYTPHAGVDQTEAPGDGAGSPPRALGAADRPSPRKLLKPAALPICPGVHPWRVDIAVYSCRPPRPSLRHEHRTGRALAVPVTPMRGELRAPLRRCCSRQLSGCRNR